MAERGTIIKSNSYLGLSGSTESTEEWIRESNGGEYTARDIALEWRKKISVLSFFTSSLKFQCECMFSDVYNIFEQEYLTAVE